jgi:hypothetical protein
MECNWSRQQIYDFALKASKKLGYNRENLSKIYYDLGGRVNSIYSPHNKNYFEVFGKSEFVLHNEWFISRYELAKAIGHYLLHSKMGTPMAIKMGEGGRMEIEGNWFAARFLLPEPEFTDMYAIWKSTARLSVHFDVPECAIEKVIETYIS